MNRLILLIAFPLLATAQNLPDVLKQGEQIFNQTCSTGYCHGTKGAGGGGPRIAARSLDQTYISNIVTRGVPQTSMPAFGASMSRGEIVAVVAYVATLNGIPNPVITGAAAAGAATAPTGPVFTGEAAKGRDLFSDVLRGFQRCSTCHEIDGIGIPVTGSFVQIPASVAALKSLATPKVATANLGGERMPAAIVSKTSRSVIFYDLTAAAPVMRTAAPDAVQFAEGSDWQHGKVITSYNDSELAAILAYMQAAIKP